MRKSMRFAAIATLTALTLATGCAKDKDPGNNNNVGMPDLLDPDPEPTDKPDMKKPPQDQGPVDPTPDPEPEVKAQYAGIYAKSSTLDLTGKGVLPGPAGDITAALANLSNAPGTAIYDIVANAGIPEVSDALKTLDSTLQLLIKEFLNQMLTKLVYDQVPAAKQVVDVIDGIAELFQKIELKSQVAFRNYDAASSSAESQEQFYAVAFDFRGNKQTFKFPVAVLPQAKIIGGKKITNIVPVNAPQANFKDALMDGGNLQTFPIGDIFVEALEKMVVQPLTVTATNPAGYDSFAALLNSVIPCADVSSDPTLQTLCQSLVTALTETALSPIKNFKFENVIVDRAKVIGYEVSVAQPNVDNLTSRLTGTQAVTFQQLFSSDVKVKIDAPFEAFRMDTPELPVVW